MNMNISKLFEDMSIWELWGANGDKILWRYKDFVIITSGPGPAYVKIVSLEYKDINIDIPEDQYDDIFNKFRKEKIKRENEKVRRYNIEIEKELNKAGKSKSLWSDLKEFFLFK